MTSLLLFQMVEARTTELEVAKNIFPDLTTPSGQDHLGIWSCSNLRLARFVLYSESGYQQLNSQSHTVDGQNPANQLQLLHDIINNGKKPTTLMINH